MESESGGSGLSLLGGTFRADVRVLGISRLAGFGRSQRPLGSSQRERRRDRSAVARVISASTRLDTALAAFPAVLPSDFAAPETLLTLSWAEPFSYSGSS